MRVWCLVDSEWCYQAMPCRGCELPQLRARLAGLEAVASRLLDLIAKDFPDMEAVCDRINDFRPLVVQATDKDTYQDQAK